MQATMDRGVGVFRTEEGLHTVCDELRVLRERYAQIKLDDRSRVFNTELFAALELGFLLDLAEAIAWAALDRRESRGSHARRDFPERDDERFLAHSMAQYAQGDPPRIDYLPVTITRWQPQARTY
jgi:succinate dehydrogenase flavoprotein subunit